MIVRSGPDERGICAAASSGIGVRTMTACGKVNRRSGKSGERLPVSTEGDVVSPAMWRSQARCLQGIKDRSCGEIGLRGSVPRLARANSIGTAGLRLHDAPQFAPASAWLPRGSLRRRLEEQCDLPFKPMSSCGLS